MLNSMPRHTLPSDRADTSGGTSRASTGVAAGGNSAGVATGGRGTGVAAGGKGGRQRLSPEERRRQLVGIGLRKFVERPVQELSLDEVAAEAGVSRGLLFHYFPTKTAYYTAVVEAAGRRVLRTVAPDEGLVGDAAVAQLVDRFFAQVARRRDSYLALVFGQVGSVHDGSGVAHADRAGSLRRQIALLALTALASTSTSTDTPTPVNNRPIGGLLTPTEPDTPTPPVDTPPTDVNNRPIGGLLTSDEVAAAHGWVAYVEDRALQWSARPVDEQATSRDADIAHCVAALHALLALAR